MRCKYLSLVNIVLIISEEQQWQHATRPGPGVYIILINHYLKKNNSKMNLLFILLLINFSFLFCFNKLSQIKCLNSKVRRFEFWTLDHCIFNHLIFNRANQSSASFNISIEENENWKILQSNHPVHLLYLEKLMLLFEISSSRSFCNSACLILSFPLFIWWISNNLLTDHLRRVLLIVEITKAIIY